MLTRVLLSALVPSASATVSYYREYTVEGNIFDACDGAYAAVSITVFDDVNTAAHASYTAEYRIDGGTWTAMTHMSSSSGQANFYASLNADGSCVSFLGDLQVHTMQMRGTTPGGTVTDTATNFSVGPTGTPVMNISLDNDVGGGIVEFASSSEVDIYGSVTVDGDFEINNDNGTPVAYQLDGGGYTAVDNFNDGFDTFNFNLGFLADGIYALDVRSTEYFSSEQHIESYTLVVGDQGVPSVSVNDIVGDEITITGIGDDITGDVSVASGSITGMGWEVDAGGMTGANAGDGTFDSGTETFQIYDIAYAASLSNGTYDLTLQVATDLNLFDFHYTLIIDMPAPPPAPTITVTQDIADTITLTTEPFNITGTTAVADVTISSMSYTITGQATNVSITADDGTFDEASETFAFNIDSLNLVNGTYSLAITSVASNAEDTVETYSLVINQSLPSDTEDPTCGATWYNQTSPNYTDDWTYTGIVCTDNIGVASASWRIYHYSAGELIVDTIDAPLVGSFGDTEVTLEFTAAIPAGPNRDGALDVELTVSDAQGNSFTYVDPMVVDYADQTEPTLSLQLVRPEILTDQTPTVTGTCSDATYRETNSNIQTIEVNVDGGGWTSVPALDGTYNSTTERFAYTTGTLSYAAHVIDVRCTDASANVNTTDATEDLEFLIEAPSVDDEAIAELYLEEFTDHDHQDFAGTTLIWGNGRLRLKEDISLARTAVDTTGFGGRYEEFLIPRNYMIVEGLDSNIAWYSKENQLWRLNRDDDSVTQFDPTDYGIGVGFIRIDDIDEFMYNGDRYLVVASLNGLFIFNLTDGLGYRDASNGDPGKVVPDLDRGRFGLYVNMIDADTGMKLAYWNLGTGADPFDGDTFTRVPTNTADMYGTDVVRIFDSPVANELYVSVYASGFFRWNDNNTPTNFADDQSGEIDSTVPGHADFDQIFGATFDPSGKLIFGTSFQESGELYVVDSDNGTPYDTSDDTVYRLGEVADLGYNDVFDVTYLAGANNVGGQIFIEMENGNPVYMNFNDTYSDSLDDTFIELVTNNGIRPSATQLIIDDYNTLYANIDRQGLYKIALDRDWESTGQAIALPPRPSKVLAINNFLANATTATPISYIPGSDSNLADAGVGGWIPQAHAQSVNITYEVSLDDGVTWDVVTLGQLRDVDLEDYRLQFRITMTPISGASPVVNTYSVAYGGYPDPNLLGIVESYEVTISPTSVVAGGPFTINITAVDLIGFQVTDYNSTVSLTLEDGANQNFTSNLSLNQITIVNGEGTATGAFINRVGTYTLVASNVDGTGRSNQVAVAEATGVVPGPGDPTPVRPTDPVLTFTADDYLVCRGQTVNLRWVSKNIAAATLNGAPVFTDGTSQVTINESTEYVLIGTGSFGSLTHRLTVYVDQSVPSCFGGTSPTLPDVPSSPSPEPSGFGGIVDSGDPSPAPGAQPSMSPGAIPTLNLSTSNNREVVAGETVRIWWTADGATMVTVDRLGGDAGTEGSFEFVARETQEIVITAFQGDEQIEKRITITVHELPSWLSGVLPPGVAGMMLRGSQTAPLYTLGALAAGYAAMSVALVVSAAAVSPILLSGETLLSAVRAAGILPFKKRQGYVYQTGTLSPIPFAILSVRSADIKRTLLATLFTGVNGEYSEPHLGQGNYLVDAVHGANSFPTLTRRPPHLGFLDFYKGEPVAVSSSRATQAIIVPMDATADAKRKAAFSRVVILRLHQVLSWLQWTVWPLFGLSILAVILNANAFNWLILAVYSALIANRLRVWLRKPLLDGAVTSEAGQPLKGVVVMLLTSDGQLVALDRTTDAGRYSFFTKPGSYTLRVIAEGYAWSEESIGSTLTVELKNGSPMHRNLSMKPFVVASMATPFGI